MSSLKKKKKKKKQSSALMAILATIILLTISAFILGFYQSSFPDMIYLFGAPFSSLYFIFGLTIFFITPIVFYIIKKFSD